MQDRYSFTNFSDEPFTGRYAGVNYSFAAGETREFDPDKHYMLLLMGKQLAERELLKKVKSVGRNPNDQNTWGKSLDEEGKPFSVTKEMRINLMRKAIGSLVDKPVPVPEEHERGEAGATKESSEDVATLKAEVSELKDMISQLITQQKTQLRTTGATDDKSVATPQSVSEPFSQSRQTLESIGEDLGIEKMETLTKEELIREINKRQVAI